MTSISPAITWSSTDYYRPQEAPAPSDELYWRDPQTELGWHAAEAELNSLLELQDDWDGEDSPAPSVSMVRSTGDLLKQLRKCRWDAPVRLLPTSDGGVLIEWNSNGTYIEIEVTEPGEGEAMVVTPDLPAIHQQLAWRPEQQPRDEAVPQQTYGTAVPWNATSRSDEGKLFPTSQSLVPEHLFGGSGIYVGAT
jgi:hypothetical protein